MPAVKPLVAILLAAGQSQRFNANKLAYSLTLNDQQKPLLLHTLDNWLAVFDSLYLMLPANDDRLMQVVESLPPLLRDKLQLINVNEPTLGMSQSIRAGVAVSRDAEGWLIGLADMPWVKPAVLQKLSQAMANGCKIAAPYYQGQRGQPVAFHADYLADLLSITGDEGARQILKANASKISAIEWSDNDILRDIDRPEDLP